jgi:hypothetical protein
MRFIPSVTPIGVRSDAEWRLWRTVMRRMYQFTHRGDVSFIEASGVVDRRLPRERGECGHEHNHRCPKGNREMRRILNQAANAAVKAKGTIFALVYRRLVPRLGHAQRSAQSPTRLCRLIWKILH